MPVSDEQDVSVADHEYIEPWELIRSYIDQGDDHELNRYVETLAPGEVARSLTRLDDDERHSFFLHLGPENAAQLDAQMAISPSVR